MALIRTSCYNKERDSVGTAVPKNNFVPTFAHVSSSYLLTTLCLKSKFINVAGRRLQIDNLVLAGHADDILKAKLRWLCNQKLHCGEVPISMWDSRRYCLMEKVHLLHRMSQACLAALTNTWIAEWGKALSDATSPEATKLSLWFPFLALLNLFSPWDTSTGTMLDESSKRKG